MEKKGILVHKKQYKNTDMICVRGSGVVPLPIDEVGESLKNSLYLKMHIFCTSIKLRYHWDNLYKNSKIVERFDDKTIILVYEYRFVGENEKIILQDLLNGLQCILLTIMSL